MNNITNDYFNKLGSILVVEMPVTILKASIIAAALGIGIVGCIGISVEFEAKQIDPQRSSPYLKEFLEVVGKTLQAISGGLLFVEATVSSKYYAKPAALGIMVVAPLLSTIVKIRANNPKIKKAIIIVDIGLGLLSKIGIVAACVFSVPACISMHQSI